MEIRNIMPEEQVQYDAIRSTVFLFNKREDIRMKYKEPFKHVNEDDHTRIGAFDDKGKLVSALRIIPFTFRINGKNEKMGGIASVVSKPEARGKGHVRALMEESLRRMESDGQIFSYLYPFSYPFYRKFGYDVCRDIRNATIPLSNLSKYPYSDNIEPYEPGDSIAPYDEIYKSFIKNRNLAVVRSETDWEKLLDRDPYKYSQFTYLYRNCEGLPAAYALFDAKKTYSGNHDFESVFDFMVVEIAWKEPEDLHRIFGFLSKLEAEAVNLQWNVPCDVDVFSLFGDCYGAKLHTVPGGMCRLVNVLEGLKTLHPPNGSGRTVVEVRDAFWTSNSGIYVLKWGSGELSVGKTSTALPDMSTTVETLTQLVTGYLSSDEAAYKLCTKITGNHSALEALFPRQRLYLLESF